MSKNPLLKWNGQMEQVRTDVQESVSTVRQMNGISFRNRISVACDNLGSPLDGKNALNVSTPNNSKGIGSRLLKRPEDLEKRTNRPYERVY